MSAKTTAAKVTVTGHETDINGIDVYSVPSESTPGTVYQVIVVDNRTICCCTAASFSRHCKHVAAVDRFRWNEAAATTRRDSAPLYRDNRPFSLFKAS
jgi:hypothetical protein